MQDLDPRAAATPEPDHAHGLAHDLRRLGEPRVKRRAALGWMAAALAGAGAGALPLLGCGGGGDDAGTSTTTTTDTTTGTTTTTTTTSTGSCSVIPTETNGPYPADGSTALNALLMSGIVRSDIRSSFNGASGVAAGIPLTVNLTLVNTSASCGSLAGYAIYIWHCNQAGEYSLYSASVASENYLRGVQETDSSGKVAFTTIFPACYSGRWPHIHVEIYPSLAQATSVSKVLKITQIALPQDACSAVYATSGYSASVANLARVSLASDNVFSDGATLETPTVSGSTSAGYAIDLAMAIAA